VSEGRVREFERMDWDVSTIPDPQDPATFRASKLDWTEVAEGRHARLLRVYRELGELRRRTPDLTDPDLRRTSCQVDEARRWFLMRRGGVAVVVNFGPAPVEVDLGGSWHDLLWCGPAGATVREGRVALPPHTGAVLAPV